MPDNKHKVGKPDRSRVSVNEPYEVNYIANKVGLPAPLVKKVIQQEGPSRTKIENYLLKMKKNGK